MTIVGANRGKAVSRGVGEVFIFDTYIDSSML